MSGAPAPGVSARPVGALTLLLLILSAGLPGRLPAQEAPLAGSLEEPVSDRGAAMVAAAAQALELERPAEARRWLALVPEAQRSWAWAWLSRRADLSTQTLIDAGSPLVAFAARTEPLRVAAATRDGRILLRDSGGAARTLAAPSKVPGSEQDGGMAALAFSPDGSRLAAAERDGSVRIVGFASGDSLSEWSVEAAGVGAVAWSPRGDRIAIGGFRWIHPDPEQPSRRRPTAFLELRRPTGELVRALKPSGFSLGALAFSPDGSWLAAGGPQGKLDLVPVTAEGAAVAIEIQESRGFPEIDALAFSGDGARLAAACGDGTVRLFSIPDGASLEKVSTPMHRAGATAVSFFPDGEGFASGGADLLIRVVDAASGGAPDVLPGHLGRIVGLAAGPDGRLVTAAEDGTVRLWSTAAIESPLVHQESVWGMAFSRDGELFATVDAAGTVRIWNRRDLRLLREIQAHETDAVEVVFTADDRELISTGNDGRVLVWDVESGELRAELEDVEDGRGVALSLSPDGRTLAAGSTRGTVKLWDLQARELLATLAGHEAEVWRALWTPDGDRVITAASDGYVVVWDAATGTEISRFHAHDAEIHGAALSPDGSHLATAGGDREIRIWRLDTQDLQRTLNGHSDRVWSLAWSPDGTLLASVSNDYTARLWDVASGLPLITWPHEIQVYKALWAPGGDTLAIAPFDGRLRLLDAAP